MTTKEQIYHAALIELANNGNESAKLALSIANNLGVNTSDFIAKLRQANTNLSDAIMANSTSWNKRTDRYIMNATEILTEVMIGLK